MVYYNLCQGLDFVVDGGIRVADPSTVVDMTGSSPKIIRQGKVLEFYFSLSMNADGTQFDVIIN